MLPRAHRLSDRRDISQVFRMGRKVRGNLFSFSYQPNTGQQTRFAVIVSKKFFPRAIDRNRAKRLIRETIRPLLPHIVAGYNGAFFATKKPAEKLSLSNVSADIEALLRKAHLLSPSDVHSSHPSTN